MIPNRVIRSELMSVYDKAIFCCIASCNPSFPSYRKMMQWTGMSMDRVWKSLRNLEQLKIIWRYKVGKKVLYETIFTAPSCGEMPGELLCFTDRTAPSGGEILLRGTEPIKNKEKEQEKENFEISFHERESV